MQVQAVMQQQCQLFYSLINEHTHQCTSNERRAMPHLLPLISIIHIINSSIWIAFTTQQILRWEAVHDELRICNVNQARIFAVVMMTTATK